MPEVETMSAAVQYETEKNTAVLRESAYYRVSLLYYIIVPIGLFRVKEARVLLAHKIDMNQ